MKEGLWFVFQHCYCFLLFIWCLSNHLAVELDYKTFELRWQDYGVCNNRRTVCTLSELNSRLILLKLLQKFYLAHRYAFWKQYSLLQSLDIEESNTISHLSDLCVWRLHIILWYCASCSSSRTCACSCCLSSLGSCSAASHSDLQPPFRFSSRVVLGLHGRQKRMDATHWFGSPSFHSLVHRLSNTTGMQCY